ncbi:MAG: ADP-ribosylation factor-like protein, partial [Candidatus Hodarchaeales archaeon]
MIFLDDNTATNGVIGFAAIWEDNKGPIIISEAPPRIIDDPISIMTQIYMFLVTQHGKDLYFSQETLEVPFYILSHEHVALVKIDHYTENGNQNSCNACFIAFLMPKNTARELTSFMPIAMQSFMRNFKRDKRNFNLESSRDILVTYLLNCGPNAGNKLVMKIGEERKNNFYRIAMAGLPHAGKTAILRRLKTGRFIENTRPTRGFDTEVLERSIT